MSLYNKKPTQLLPDRPLSFSQNGVFWLYMTTDPFLPGEVGTSYTDTVLMFLSGTDT